MIFILYQKIRTLPKIHTLLKYSYLTENFEHQMCRCYFFLSIYFIIQP